MDKNKKLFPQRLWELINDGKYSFCLRWSPDGQRVYLNRNEFESNYLKTPSNQFHTQKAISFVRQMNMYGFRKVDDCYYENDNFKKNSPHLLKSMVRRHSNKSFHFFSHSSSSAPQVNHHNHGHHSHQNHSQQQHNSQNQGSLIQQARHYNTRHHNQQQHQHKPIHNNQRAVRLQQHNLAAADSQSILSQSQTSMFHQANHRQLPMLAASTSVETPPAVQTAATAAANQPCTISQLPVRTTDADPSLSTTTTSPTSVSQCGSSVDQQHRQQDMLVAALNNSNNLNNGYTTNSSSSSCCSTRSAPLASSTLYHRLAALNFNQSSAHIQLASEHQHQHHQHLLQQLKQPQHQQQLSQSQPLTQPLPPTLTLQQQNLLASLQQQDPNLLLESLANLGSVAAAAVVAAVAAANSAPQQHQHQPFDATSLEEGARPLELVVNAAPDPSITQSAAQEHQNLLISRFLNNHLLERANLAASTTASSINSRSSLFDHSPQDFQAVIDDNDDAGVDDGNIANHAIERDEDSRQVIGGECTIDYGDEIFNRNGRLLTNTSSSSSSTTNQEPLRYSSLTRHGDSDQEEEDYHDDDDEDVNEGTILNLAKPSNTRSNQQMNCTQSSYR